ncbi:MAG: EutP/PduV family microcompartment system protein [Peptostreptococcaceae bacterium]|nr:EutP/PduV family microcompartment system protein [Peptostreptococcaceae bacterium]
METLKKKIILIGGSQEGKTTICQYINNQKQEYQKTQAVVYVGDTMIDTPGEYAERRSYYGSLQIISVDADVVIFVKDASKHMSIFAPTFSSMFTKPVIGVITHIDVATKKQIQDSHIYLELAGARPVFEVCALTGKGIDKVIKYINKINLVEY